MQTLRAMTASQPDHDAYRAALVTLTTAISHAEDQQAPPDALAPYRAAEGRYRLALDVWDLARGLHVTELVPSPDLEPPLEAAHVRIDRSAEPARIQVAEALSTIWQTAQADVP